MFLLFKKKELYWMPMCIIMVFAVCLCVCERERERGADRQADKLENLIFQGL